MTNTTHDDFPGLHTFNPECEEGDEPASVVEGILGKGEKLLLGGPFRSGKSLVLLQLGAAVCSGGKWLDTYKCSPGRVLYINLMLDEGSFDHRLHRVNKEMPFDWKRLSVWSLRGHIRPLPEVSAKLLSMMGGETPFDLIVIDHIYATFEGNRASARDTCAFCNAIDSIAESTGAAVAYSHSLPQGCSDADTACAIPNSGIFWRDPDSLGVMTPLKDEKAYRLNWLLRNYPPQAPLALRFEYPLHVPMANPKDWAQAG